MKKKTKILISVLVAVVVLASGGLIIWNTMPQKQPIKGDIHDTPIPVSVSVDAASTAPAELSKVAIDKKDLPVTSTTPDATLFGEVFTAVEYATEAEFVAENGMKTAEQTITEYFAENSDKVLYTAVSDHETRDIYNADGKLVYSTGYYKPETDYETESMHWFYKDGKLSVCEMFFFDLESKNIGVAYYDKDGKLLCLTTEIYTTKKGEPVIENTYYNPNFETIDEVAFLALIPETDAPQFLYPSWS